MTPEQRENLPEGVECKFCNDGRLFHQLSSHLHYIHKTIPAEYRTHFDISQDEPLYSSSYSKNRAIVSSRPANVRRVTGFANRIRSLLDQSIDVLVTQGFYTTGGASKLKSVTTSSLKQAIREERLTAGLVCLIAIVEDEDSLRVDKLDGTSKYIIEQNDLALYKKSNQARLRERNNLREQSIDSLVAQGFYTTGRAAKALSLDRGTFNRAIRSQRLMAGQSCLINYATENEKLRIVPLPGVSPYLMQKDDLKDFASTQRQEVQNRALQNL